MQTKPTPQSFLDTDDYMVKPHKLLDDCKSYTLLEKDPTQQTERRLLTLLRKLKKDKKIDDVFYDRVKPLEGLSRSGLFYGKAKVHKASVPYGQSSLLAALQLTI